MNPAIITDYTREPGKLAELLTHIAYGDNNLIEGRQLLLLRNAIDDLEGIGHAAMKRRDALQQDAREERLDSVNIVVRDLHFSELNRLLNHWNCPDMCADGDQVLIVYYKAEADDEEEPIIELHAVAPVAPLVLRGEDAGHVIGAYADIREGLVGDRIDEIKDKVLDAIRMLQGEARVDVAMAEAA